MNTQTQAIISTQWRVFKHKEDIEELAEKLAEQLAAKLRGYPCLRVSCDISDDIFYRRQLSLMQS